MPQCRTFVHLLLALFSLEAFGRSLGFDALAREDAGIGRRMPKFLLRFT